MTKKTIGTIDRGERHPIELEHVERTGDYHLWQGSDLILMNAREARQLALLLQQAVSAPEPLRRFPALYERLRIHDTSTGRTWPEHRYAIEVGAGSDPTEGRAHVRLDGDESPGIDGVFLWDEDARAFYFKGGDSLYLIPVNASEEN